MKLQNITCEEGRLSLEGANKRSDSHSHLQKSLSQEQERSFPDCRMLQLGNIRTFTCDAKTDSIHAHVHRHTQRDTYAHAHTQHMHECTHKHT